MSVINNLASVLGRRDEAPNKELAQNIVDTKDKKAIRQLFTALANCDKNIQSDCIKVLDEVAAKEAKLVSGYAVELIALLDSKNNRLQWGAMTAIDSIAAEVPDIIYTALAKIVGAADRGSVITKDHCIGILVKLCLFTRYADEAFQLYLEQLKAAPANQFPTYAEQAVAVLNNENLPTYMSVLAARLPEIEQDTKRRRVEKILRKINK